MAGRRTMARAAAWRGAEARARLASCIAISTMAEDGLANLSRRGGHRDGGGNWGARAAGEAPNEFDRKGAAGDAQCEFRIAQAVIRGRLPAAANSVRGCFDSGDGEAREAERASADDGGGELILRRSEAFC